MPFTIAVALAEGGKAVATTKTTRTSFAGTCDLGATIANRTNMPKTVRALTST